MAEVTQWPQAAEWAGGCRLGPGRQARGGVGAPGRVAAGERRPGPSGPFSVLGEAGPSSRRGH